MKTCFFFFNEFWNKISSRYPFSFFVAFVIITIITTNCCSGNCLRGNNSRFRYPFSIIKHSREKISERNLLDLYGDGNLSISPAFVGISFDRSIQCYLIRAYTVFLFVQIGPEWIAFNRAHYRFKSVEYKFKNSDLNRIKTLERTNTEMYVRVHEAFKQSSTNCLSTGHEERNTYSINLDYKSMLSSKRV